VDEKKYPPHTHFSLNIKADTDVTHKLKNYLYTHTIVSGWFITVSSFCSNRRPSLLPFALLGEVHTHKANHSHPPTYGAIRGERDRLDALRK
jgi:hypothetical protein